MMVMALVIYGVVLSDCSSHGKETDKSGHSSNPIIPIHILVNVSNHIKPNLTIHCKSKDDDLGEHTLAYAEYFSWKFKVNIIFTTLFWCNMWWIDSNGKQVHGGYDIYRYTRDWWKCYNYCEYPVRDIGLLI
ncbi:hypothetical protein MKX01_002211 [Papaver californicum]|nr:hypothetical protein MKX01_002211 [Papaver californicum]